MYYTLYHEHRDSGDENYKRISRYLNNKMMIYLDKMNVIVILDLFLTNIYVLVLSSVEY